MNTHRGYIALVSVLLAGGIMLIAVLTLSRMGVDGANTASAEEASAHARLLADACAEEALVRLRANLAYLGNESIMVNGAESCAIKNVSGSGPTDRTIATEAVVSGYVRHVTVTVATVTPNLVIGSWLSTPN